MCGSNFAACQRHVGQGSEGRSRNELPREAVVSRRIWENCRNENYGRRTMDDDRDQESAIGSFCLSAFDAVISKRPGTPSFTEGQTTLAKELPALKNGNGIAGFPIKGDKRVNDGHLARVDGNYHSRQREVAFGNIDSI